MKTLTQATNSKNLYFFHRGVAPVIATLLMVAIAVVGGTIIFVFAQEFFSYSQISGTSQIESLKITGYDATDSDALQAHEGTPMLAASGGTANNLKEIGERVAVYVKNDSVQKISIAELRFGGQLYTFDQGVTTLDTVVGATAPTQGGFVILNDPATNGLLNSNSADLQPGETVSIILGLNQNIQISRDTQFNLKTTNGNVMVGTINIGTRE